MADEVRDQILHRLTILREHLVEASAHRPIDEHRRDAMGLDITEDPPFVVGNRGEHDPVDAALMQLADDLQLLAWIILRV